MQVGRHVKTEAQVLPGGIQSETEVLTVGGVHLRQIKREDIKGVAHDQVEQRRRTQQIQLETTRGALHVTGKTGLGKITQQIEVHFDVGQVGQARYIQIAFDRDTGTREVQRRIRIHHQFPGTDVQ